MPTQPRSFLFARFCVDDAPQAIYTNSLKDTEAPLAQEIDELHMRFAEYLADVNDTVMQRMAELQQEHAREMEDAREEFEDQVKDCARQMKYEMWMASAKQKAAMKAEHDAAVHALVAQREESQKEIVFYKGALAGVAVEMRKLKAGSAQMAAELAASKAEVVLVTNKLSAKRNELKHALGRLAAKNAAVEDLQRQLLEARAAAPEVEQAAMEPLALAQKAEKGVALEQALRKQEAALKLHPKLALTPLIIPEVDYASMSDAALSPRWCPSHKGPSPGVTSLSSPEERPGLAWLLTGGSRRPPSAVLPSQHAQQQGSMGGWKIRACHRTAAAPLTLNADLPALESSSPAKLWTAPPPEVACTLFEAVKTPEACAQRRQEQLRQPWWGLGHVIRRAVASFHAC